ERQSAPFPIAPFDHNRPRRRQLQLQVDEVARAQIVDRYQPVPGFDAKSRQGRARFDRLERERERAHARSATRTAPRALAISTICAMTARGSTPSVLMLIASGA